MAGMPKTQRDQVMLFVGIIGLALAGAYYYFVYQPKSLVLEELTARVERLDAVNKRAETIIARGSVEEMRAEAAAMRENLALMRTLIPASNEVPALLDQILGAARRTGLEFSNFAPSGTIPGEQFDTYRFRVSLQGSYHQIGRLLTAIGSLQRVIAPINLTLTSATQRGVAAGNARASAPDEPQLTASFDIQTYVVKTVVPEEAP